MKKLILLSGIAVLAFWASDSWANTYKYTYDAHGNIMTNYTCDVDGNNCRTTNVYENTYDTNGNLLARKYCGGSDIASDGKCKGYSGGDSYIYNNGKMSAEMHCNMYDSDGNCTMYGSRTEYTYDGNGNKSKRKGCSEWSMNSDGTCRSYDSGGDYTYDANGNMLAQRSCSGINSNTGACTSYIRKDVYTYDNNGNMLTSRVCYNTHDGGTCSKYKIDNLSGFSAYDYTYENGNKISKKCSSMDTTTGVCSAYSTNASDTRTYLNEYPDEYLSCTSWSNGRCTACSSGSYLESGACIIENTDCPDGFEYKRGEGCVDKYPYSKKHWTPAEVNKWLKDDDNTITITFKKQ